MRVGSNTEGAVGVQAIITERQLALPWAAGRSGVQWHIYRDPAEGYTGPVVGSGTVHAYGSDEWISWFGGVSEPDRYGGRTYTGSAIVSFGTTVAGGGQIIFMIGSPGFVVGNEVFAAQSPAFIEDGRTFIGIRDLENAIGARVTWDGTDRTATVIKDNITVVVTIGSDKLLRTVGGVSTEMEIDVPAFIRNDRTYLPLRFLGEAFDYDVTYTRETQSIVIAPK